MSWRFLAASLAVLALAVLRGLQLPLLWTSTHYLFNYGEGFLKRGLFGQLLAFFLGEARFRYQILATVAFVVLALLLLALFVGSVRQKNPYFLVLLGGPAGAYLLLEVGYLDQVLYLLAVVGAFVALKAPRWRHPATLFAGLVGLFVHEGALFMTCPLLVFVCLLAGRRESRSLSRELAPFLAFPLVALAISEWPLPSPAAVKSLFLQAQTHADFAVRADAYDVFSRRAADNAGILLDLWRTGQMRQRLNEVLPFAVLYSAASFFGLTRVLAKSPLIYAAACATLAPLVLACLGWDLDRWGALVMLNAFLCLFFAVESFGAAIVRQALRLPAGVVLVAVVVGAFARYPFMIGHPERLPPYETFGDFQRPSG